jgi:cell division protein ZapA
VNQPNVVTVQIAGEEYTIRTPASADYTRDCAAHVDRTIQEILSAGPFMQVQKAGILAALAVTDQLFQARREAEELRAELDRLAVRLRTDVDARLAKGDLAARS